MRGEDEQRKWIRGCNEKKWENSREEENKGHKRKDKIKVYHKKRGENTQRENEIKDGTKVD